MCTRVFLAAALLAMHMTAATAADDAYPIVGNGDVSCEQFSAGFTAKAEPTWSARRNINWIAGYLTAYNRYNNDGVKNILTTNSRGVEEWLVDYCQNNPSTTLASAAHAFVVAHLAAAKK